MLGDGTHNVDIEPVRCEPGSCLVFIYKFFSALAGVSIALVAIKNKIYRKSLFPE